MHKYDLAEASKPRTAVRNKRAALPEAFQPESYANQNPQWSYSILNAVIEGTTDAIFVKDIEGRYIMVNSALTAFLNLPPEAIIGKKDSDLYTPETTRQFQEQDMKVFSTGETHVFEGIATGSATEQIYLVTKSVYRDLHGNIIGLIGISHDITDRKKAEEQKIAFFREQEVRLIAEEANRHKDEFLATLSHELRTPLACILGWSCLLKTEHFDTEARNNALAIIERNARAQMQLIGDLLDVSRVINGHESLNFRQIDVISVVKTAMESVEPTANTKLIELESKFGFEPVLVNGDVNRLQQVFWNLLVNAIKFTPEKGRITVAVERVGNGVEISISDTGEGIEPDFLPYVFERFRQANHQILKSHGGLGLGLAIVRNFVELHGGFVKAESGGKGRGSKFTVTIPLVANGLETDIEKRRVTKEGGDNPLEFVQPNLEGVKVLVVDDEPDTVKLIEAALGNRGAAVVASASAEAALKIIRKQKPDLIISDIQLEGEDGYSLIRKVRTLSEEDGGRIPAVAFTAYVRESDRINAFMAGFQLHVAKPINPLELVAITASLTGRVAFK